MSHHLDAFNFHTCNLPQPGVVTKESSLPPGPCPQTTLSSNSVFATYQSRDLERTSLVVQWFRSHLPMQGTRFQSLVGELRFHVAVVQSPSRVRLLATPWTAARQVSLSITSSQSLPKFMSTDLGATKPDRHNY